MSTIAKPSKPSLKTLLIFLVIGFILGSITVFAISKIPKKEAVLAVVDGQEIKEAQIVDIMREKSGVITLQNYIDKMIIDNSAKSYGISVSDSEVSNELKRKILMEYQSEKAFTDSLYSLGLTLDDAKEELRQSMLFDKVATKDIKVNFDEVDKFFKANRDAFIVPEKRRVSEIVLKDEADAKMVREQLTQGDDFKAIARQKSIGPDKENGGDRGFMIMGTLNNLQPEVEKVVFQIYQNEISPVIKSKDGYHIIVVNEITPKYEPDFETIKDFVTLKVKLEKCKSYSEILNDLRKASNIKINDEKYKLN